MCLNGGGEDLNDHLQTRMEQILAFERVNCDKMNNNDLFREMLRLRQELIEKPLRMQHKNFTPWSLEMLKQHFMLNSGGHGTQVRRDTKQEMDKLRAIMMVLEDGGIIMENRLTKTKSVDRGNTELLLKLSKRRSELKREHEEERLKEDILAQDARNRNNSEALKYLYGMQHQQGLTRSTKRKEFAISGVGSMPIAQYYSYKRKKA